MKALFLEHRIHKILTVFRPAFRPSSGWCSYTRIQKYKCG